MNYFEVLPADSHYRANKPLTYAYDGEIESNCVVTVQLKNRTITGVIVGQVDKPKFDAKPIKAILSTTPLPDHCFKLANWMSDYYASSISECLRQFTPAKPIIRKVDQLEIADYPLQQQWHSQLNSAQKTALSQIKSSTSTTILLHGETGSGKTRVYVELATETLAANKSVMILTPEITLTSQLVKVFESHISNYEIVVLHSRLTDAKRKKLWMKILTTTDPLIIIGPRSVIFSPIKNLGLIVLDEAHEPAYKQDQNPRYHAGRVASMLGSITGARVILGSATPSIEDYYLAKSHSAVVEMQQIKTKDHDVDIEVVDIKDRTNFSESQHLSRSLIQKIEEALHQKKQVLIYLNRRGSSRLILCNKCAWQFICPNCDIPLVYHSDKHNVRCHICNFTAKAPISCPECHNTDLIYRSIGSKSLATELARLFPTKNISRFDGDSDDGERLEQVYPDVVSGKVDILVGTQLLAKGLDLPKLGLVGIVAAESSMGLPDFSSEERTFQLLYQVIGRVGRGHGMGKVVIQTYEPESMVIKTAAKRDWIQFYDYCLKDRQQFRYPPFSYLLQLICRRSTETGAKNAASRLRTLLQNLKLQVEIIGPSPAFYARRGDNYYYQIVVKSKTRSDLLTIAGKVPSDWQIDLDPVNLL